METTEKNWKFPKNLSTPSFTKKLMVCQKKSKGRRTVEAPFSTTKSLPTLVSLEEKTPTQKPSATIMWQFLRNHKYIPNKIGCLAILLGLWVETFVSTNLVRFFKIKMEIALQKIYDVKKVNAMHTCKPMPGSLPWFLRRAETLNQMNISMMLSNSAQTWCSANSVGQNGFAQTSWLETRGVSKMKNRILQLRMFFFLTKLWDNKNNINNNK